MSLMQMLAQVAGGDDTVRQVSQQLGVDQGSAQKAISSAIPVLVGALARNTESSQGAASLDRALERDHDGGILDNLQGFLGGGNTGMGDAILGHVLGQRRPAVETGVGKMSGLNSGQVGQLLAMLAPLVMGVLGKQKRQAGLGAKDLAGMLNEERSAFERQEPQSMGMLGQLLDQDGDGQIMDDVANIGAGLLGKFLSSRR